MKKQNLKYILKALDYGLNDCDDKLENKTTHFNLFANAINLVENELNKLSIHCEICNDTENVKYICNDYIIDICNDKI